MSRDVLIVDDEADIRVLTAGILEDEGYSTREAATSDEALAAIRARRPSLVLLDIWLQDSALDGLGILEEVQRTHPGLPVLMMSGHGTIETAVSAIKLGAYDFIEKPFKTDRMLLMIDRAIEAARLRRENEELRLRTGGPATLVGRSSAISQVRHTVDRVAAANSRVLVTGPAGSGKEVVARLIHDCSRRSAGPFVVLNCATMDPDTFEVELFGTEAPEGEGGRKVGSLEAADKGTLLLDEVADMPLETQGRIVRVLQEQTFERVGGTTRVQVDARVIAATTRDLGEEMAGGRFREDLFYRLNVVPVAVPPLRERLEDVPLLAAFFMEQAASSLGHRARALGEDAVAALQRYDWPGNVRELRNVIERLLILAPGGPEDPIRADMLPAEIVGGATAGLGHDTGAELMSLPLREAREIFERQYLLGQVARFGGNISRTASFVGMERSALHRKLKSLGVNSDDKLVKARQ
ncbi:MAG: sigma-54-dependent Fis family transcriptional regulator [Hyphomicrobiales bacterium]|nr:sigma-54-dependent Fis family transcriptional regulator [Hyphomicrobiales bacterium]